MTREMKYSGAEWIGDIPSEWKIRKIKNVCSLYTGNSIKDNEKNNFTDSTNAIPYIATKEIDVSSSKINYDNGMYVKKDDRNFKVAPKHSTLMCIEGGSAGKKIAYLNQEVCFVNKLCCFSTKTMNDKFLHFYLKSPSFNAEFNLHISGLIGGVSQGELKEFSIAIPPLQKQKKIADFLDSKVSEIDKIIAETKSSIENYKEYKQSVITEAVTKGLDKNVPMKDSGIEWIGDIPVGWEIMKIKHIGIARNGLTYSPAEMCDKEIGKIVLRSSNIKNDRLSFEDNVYVSKNIPENLMVRKNDILICSRNGSKHLIGKNAIIENNISASFGAFMMIFRTNYNAKYVKYILDSNVFKYYLGTFLTATINQLTNDNFSNMKVVFCQDEKQQEKIVDYLNNRCAEIDNIISEKEKLITNLEEYKKSLIYEYVTGKKAVE